jgi:katanin p60 ATPase-containing subunit A1
MKPPVPQAAKGGPQQSKGGAKAGKVDANGRAAFVSRSGDEDLVASIQADIFLGNLKVKWDDVAGLGEAKESLKEAMVLPLLLPEFFQGCRQPHKGILLYGPPGTGKTMLAKAASTQCETTFFNVSPTTLASKWRGDSERLVRVLFEMARHYAPSTIFVDEIDALCSQRGSGEHEATRRMKTEFLTQVDGVASGGEGKLVMVLGATNMPWEIDEGFLRRLSKRIYIPLPSQSSRVELLTITTRGILLAEDVNFSEIAGAMENYSGSDIASICKEASLMALRKGMGGLQMEDIKRRASEIQKELCARPLCKQDFFDAMKRVRSSTNQTIIAKYEKWTEEFGCL